MGDKALKREQYLNIDKPVGSWVWNVPYFVADPEQILTFCEQNKIDELYVLISGEVTDARYVDLLRLCVSKGIRLSALSGDSHWVYPNRRQDYDKFLKRLGDIQEQCRGAARFTAIHMDANPHVLPEARENDMKDLVAPFTDFVRTVREDADRLGLQLEWDVPSWFHILEDERAGCKLTETIMRLCDCVNVLCFRDSAKDQLDALMPNLNLARRLNKPFRIACETLNVDEERRPDNNSCVTYYEEGYLYMYECLHVIDQTLRDDYQEYGFAIHDIIRWMQLQPYPLPQYMGDCGPMDMDQYVQCLKAIG